MDNKVWLKKCAPIVEKYAKKFYSEYSWIGLDDFRSVAALEILEKLEKYEAKNNASEKTFLTRCVIHALINYVKDQRKHHAFTVDIDIDEPSNGYEPSAEELMIVEETMNELADDEIDKVIIKARIKYKRINQDAIVGMCEDAGFDVSQSTISRRIQKLKDRGLMM